MVFAAAVFIVISVICSIFFSIRVIQRKKTTGNITRSDILALITALAFVVAGIILLAVPFPLVSVGLGGMCLALLAVIAANDAEYKKTMRRSRRTRNNCRKSCYKRKNPMKHP